MTNTLSEVEQTDPGNVEDSKLDQLEPLVPRRLYLFWESQHWAAGAFNFERDHVDWTELPEERRSMLIRTIAPFFAAEERVAMTFAPIILSAEDQQEAAFLATQQVDEARHMQFFERFWGEVIEPGEAASRTPIDSALANCNDSFQELFDRRLLQVLNRLQANPRDAEAKVEAVTIYHLIAEGTMGLTGLHFLIGYLEKNSIFPAMAEGLHNVKRDEHRHVGYGTWYLRRKCREHDRYGYIVQNTLMDVLPIACAVLIEGGMAVCDGLDPVEFLDFSSAAVNYFALLGLSRRLKVIGGATQEIQQFAASGAWRAARVL